jgi:NAD(P)-dependent dehydrogenase (short-subunit alcohol dehydrogenase family)
VLDALEGERMATPERICLITGVTGAIGQATAIALAEQGFTLVGLGRHPPSQWQGEFVECDFLKPASLESACSHIDRMHDPIWALVNIAGSESTASLDASDREQFERLLQVNVTAPLLLAATATKKMTAGGGRVISVSSVVADGKAARGMYAATKAALNALSRTWAIELGSRGITSNTVSPGPVETPMLRSVYAHGSAAERQLLSNVPSGRLTMPSEIAAVIGFLLSDAAAHITGHDLRVDGGLSVGLR